MNKIILGTAQFGMDYGINNQRGKIPRKEAFEILNQALEAGIDTLDTAYNYGTSEETIGKFLQSCHKSFSIVSKLPECKKEQVKKIFDASLEKLCISKIYGYLVHNFSSLKNNPKIWEELRELKNQGKVKKIGFSFYQPCELKFVLAQGLKIDIVQVPFNVFDQRFKSCFPELKKRGIEIHSRSIFLQGIVFKKPDELDGYFEPIKNKIRRLNLLSQELHLSIAFLCLNFALLNESIDRVVVGVDNLDNLREIIQANSHNVKVKEAIPQLLRLRDDNENMIVPFNWKISCRAT